MTHITIVVVEIQFRWISRESNYTAVVLAYIDDTKCRANKDSDTVNAFGRCLP